VPTYNPSINAACPWLRRRKLIVSQRAQSIDILALVATADCSLPACLPMIQASETRFMVLRRMRGRTA
jgi:hypothetical protein